MNGSMKAAQALGPITENISKAPQPCRAPQQHFVNMCPDVPNTSGSGLPGATLHLVESPGTLRAGGGGGTFSVFVKTL